MSDTLVPGQTIGILKRSEEMLAALPMVDDRLRDPESEESEQPAMHSAVAQSSALPLFVFLIIDGSVLSAHAGSTC